MFIMRRPAGQPVKRAVLVAAMLLGLATYSPAAARGVPDADDSKRWYGWADCWLSAHRPATIAARGSEGPCAVEAAGT